MKEIKSLLHQFINVNLRYTSVILPIQSLHAYSIRQIRRILKMHNVGKRPGNESSLTIIKQAILVFNSILNSDSNLCTFIT